MSRAGPVAEERQRAGDKELHEDAEARLWRAWKADGAAGAREQIFSRYASFARSIAHWAKSLRLLMVISSSC